MFKKLVSNLPFSPSLIGQLGFFANRLRREESLRRLGVSFTLLAIIVQAFATLMPPESANAAERSNPVPVIQCNAGSLDTCQSDIATQKTAINHSQNDANATALVAQAGDTIAYNITAVNIGDEPASFTLADSLADALEYSIIDNDGAGVFDQDNQTLSWNNITLPPGQSVTRSFAVTVDHPVAAMPQGLSNPQSYDCIMTNSAGDIVTIRVACPAVKTIVEQTARDLPTTGVGVNFLVSGIVLLLTLYFWARSRQLATEVRLIRRDFNAGTL